MVSLKSWQWFHLLQPSKLCNLQADTGIDTQYLCLESYIVVIVFCECRWLHGCCCCCCCCSYSHSIHPTLVDQKMVVQKGEGHAVQRGKPSGKIFPRKPACVAMTISPGYIGKFRCTSRVCEGKLRISFV